MKHPALVLLSLTVLAPLLTAGTASPAPYGALPSSRQLKWHEHPFYAFVHFGPNTFTNREWGFGDEDPKKFNPTAFDARQIVSAAKAGGMDGLIFTAKHHDGLCLWPTKSTAHNITKTPFRDGKGDMVREFAEACRAEGVRYGVYVSPWDRNHADFGGPGYVRDYATQITELVSNYGPIFEMWFDGACGGDGYYGGKRGNHRVDYATYYGWKNVREIIRTKQPDCAIWGNNYKEDGRISYADAHWGGSEQGHVNETCWQTLASSVTREIGEHEWGTGVRNGDVWCGAEGDVSIRPGWFWHAHENTRVKSPAQLWQIYLKSVGRGANLILNLPPDTRGLLHENDVESLTAFGAYLKSVFAENLAHGASFVASNTRAGATGNGPDRLVDGDRWSAWYTDDAVTTPSVEITLPKTTTFNLIRLGEDIRLGQRIEGVAVDAWENGAWREIAKATSVGPCRLCAIAPVTTGKVRVRVTKSPVCPALSDFGLFLAPEPPQVKFGVKLKAQDRTGWTITTDHPGNTAAAKAIDGNPATLWHTHAKSESGLPVNLTLDLGKPRTLKGFTALPRQDGTPHGVVDRYRAEVSLDGVTWTKVAEGEFSNIRANPVEQSVFFDKPVTARHLRLTALHALEKNHASFAEIGIIE